MRAIVENIIHADPQRAFGNLPKPVQAVVGTAERTAQHHRITVFLNTKRIQRRQIAGYGKVTARTLPERFPVQFSTSGQTVGIHCAASLGMRPAGIRRFNITELHGSVSGERTGDLRTAVNHPPEIGKPSAVRFADQRHRVHTFFPEFRDRTRQERSSRNRSSGTGRGKALHCAVPAEPVLLRTKRAIFRITDIPDTLRRGGIIGFQSAYLPVRDSVDIRFRRPRPGMNLHRNQLRFGSRFQRIYIIIKKRFPAADGPVCNQLPVNTQFIKTVRINTDSRHGSGKSPPEYGITVDGIRRDMRGGRKNG